MKCDTKMMVRIGIGIVAVLGISYFALPDARALIIASADLSIVNGIHDEKHGLVHFI